MEERKLTGLKDKTKINSVENEKNTPKEQDIKIAKEKIGEMQVVNSSEKGKKNEQFVERTGEKRTKFKKILFESTSESIDSKSSPATSQPFDLRWKLSQARRISVDKRIEPSPGNNRANMSKEEFLRDLLKERGFEQMRSLTYLGEISKSFIKHIQERKNVVVVTIFKETFYFGGGRKHITASESIIWKINLAIKTGAINSENSPDSIYAKVMRHKGYIQMKDEFHFAGRELTLWGQSSGHSAGDYRLSLRQGQAVFYGTGPDKTQATQNIILQLMRKQCVDLDDEYATIKNQQPSAKLNVDYKAIKSSQPPAAIEEPKRPATKREPSPEIEIIEIKDETTDAAATMEVKKEEPEIKVEPMLLEVPLETPEERLRARGFSLIEGLIWTFQGIVYPVWRLEKAAAVGLLELGIVCEEDFISAEGDSEGRCQLEVYWRLISRRVQDVAGHRPDPQSWREALEELEARRELCSDQGPTYFLILHGFKVSPKKLDIEGKKVVVWTGPPYAQAGIYILNDIYS